jgi:hypothetical protein
MNEGEWIGVDLDRTLAKYDTWKGAGHIGEPIPKMVERVKRWLAAGIEVRIFSARISDDPDNIARDAITDWSIEHIGQPLVVTCEKDYQMVQIWDDRAVSVEPNTGEILTRGIEDDDE